MATYCRECGHALEQRSAFGKTRGVCPNCGYTHFDDPKVAVGVVVEKDGGIVLGRRNHEPKLGCWSFPSGFVDAGEVPEDAARREVEEETGLEVRIDRLLGVYSRPASASSSSPTPARRRRHAERRRRVHRGRRLPARRPAGARLPQRRRHPRSLVLRPRPTELNGSHRHPERQLVLRPAFSSSSSRSSPPPAAAISPSRRPLPPLHRQHPPLLPQPPHPLPPSRPRRHRLERLRRFECADFSVPLDYANPARGELKLALHPPAGRNQANRIGSLLVNPGGPGGSGIDFLRGWSPAVPREISDRFDLVSFDPRGVGQSSPIVCGENVQELLALNPDPVTDAEWQTVVDETKAFTDLCKQHDGHDLPFYGTDNVARDMDRIREGLGEDKLTYVGYSYGTSIGQVYADLFPDNVRAMVLDGAVDNSLDADTRNLEQLVAFEAALNRFIDYCRSTRCFSVDPQVAIQTLIDRAEASPIAAPGEDRPLREGEVLWGLISSLYARFQWGGLANAISDALNGNGSRMLRLVDNLWGRNSDGTYDNFFDANSAVNCIDQRVDRNPDHHRQLSLDFAKQAPIFGAWGGYLNLTCALWDAEPVPLRTPRAAGAPPILVIGNTGDPATPLKWSSALSKQLESGVLLTNDAEGHTAYLQGDFCIEKTVNAYLLDLTVPAPGSHCGNAGIEPVPPLP